MGTTEGKTMENEYQDQVNAMLDDVGMVGMVRMILHWSVNDPETGLNFKNAKRLLTETAQVAMESEI